jgi:calpain-15
MRHQDLDFLANGTALVGGDGGLEKDKDVEWIRAGEIVGGAAIAATEGDVELGGQQKAAKAHLFDGKIEPSDIAQGALGDCWLLSAIATLAEKKGMIERIFKEKTHSVWGKYTLRFYRADLKCFRNVVIDDFIPTKNGEPIFTKPNGNEMWVLLLEKAFAKLVGGYGKLEGGMPLWALEVMTGDHVAHWTLDKQHWQKQELVHMETKADKRKAGLRAVGEKKSTPDFFAIMEKYEKQDACMAAYSVGDDDTQNTNGIVKGHAYSILNVKTVSGGLTGTTRHFLQLRNPWGTFSWEGDWSDKSDLWKKHSDVKSALGWKTSEATGKDDGVFWMIYEDFMKYFNGVDILDRETGIGNIVLDVNEDEMCGPLRGCCRACGRYYCCCEGPTALCCPHHSSEDTVVVKKCCC